MLLLLPVLLPILLIDIANPVLFAMMIFAAGSRRPIANSLALLAGHTLAYFVAGIGVSFAIDSVMARLENPQAIDFVIGGIIGASLMWSVLATRKEGPATADEPEGEMTVVGSLGLGAIVNFVGVPFALPYFAAIDQVLKADLGFAESLAVLVAYNLAYALPFLIVPIAIAIAGDRAKPMLTKINSGLTRVSAILMPWMLGLLGIALVVDAAAYFWRGEGLW